MYKKNNYYNSNNKHKNNKVAIMCSNKFLMSKNINKLLVKLCRKVIKNVKEKELNLMNKMLSSLKLSYRKFKKLLLKIKIILNNHLIHLHRYRKSKN